MTPIANDELVIVRHAPADHGGRLCGRTNVAAILPDQADLGGLRVALNHLTVVTSPAIRCKATAEALCDHPMDEDARFWEQDFGSHEGLSFGDLPDIGTKSHDDLARYAAPDGESFLDMVARVKPAFLDCARRVRADGPVAVFAHAGTARAALGLALENPALGLKFEIAPLSLTRLRCLEDGFSIVAVNEQVVG